MYVCVCVYLFVSVCAFTQRGHTQGKLKVLLSMDGQPSTLPGLNRQTKLTTILK